MKSLPIFMVLVALSVWPVYAYGQMELQLEQNSSHGFDGIAFVVNIEQNMVFANTSLVDIAASKKAGEKVLRKNHVHLYSNREARKSTRIPMLYMHKNMLRTRTGVISFAVNANLIQPVKLMLHNDKQTTATTWQYGIVGIASYDKISVIKQAAMSTALSFVSAFKKANSER